MEIIREGSVNWTGGLKDGKGAISTESGALLDYPYGFASRFEGVRGSNPEELLGAAHAACFTMSLALTLDKIGVKADRIETTASVTLIQQSGGFTIPHIVLTSEAHIPAIEAATFQELAAEAERNCPVSKLFRAEITLVANLAGPV